MTTLIDLTNQLNEYLQVERFKDYCVNGLQVEGKPHVKSVACAVTASLNVIEKAKQMGADALIVHHGLFWGGEPLSIKGALKKKLALLIEGNISLLAYHLPLDAHPEIGNNAKAAKDLGFQNLKPFYFSGNEPIGVAGEFSPIEVDLFQKKLEKYYGQKAHAALGGKKEVTSCALISGGAWKQIDEALKLGVDCFVTGNFDEPAWHLAKEGGIHFFALGHAATEKVGPKSLALFLQEHFPLKTVFIDEENPF